MPYSPGFSLCLLSRPDSSRFTIAYYAGQMVRQEGFGSLFRGLHVQLARNVLLLPLFLSFEGLYSAYKSSRQVVPKVPRPPSQ